MTLIIELIFIFIFVNVSNNFFIKKTVLKKEIILNCLGFIISIAILQRDTSALTTTLTIILISSTCLLALGFKEHLLVGFILQILAIPLILKTIEGHSFLDLQNIQSISLWGEVPSWNIIFQPFAFALLSMSAIYYSQVTFLKSLIIWALVYIFLGGSFVRNIEASSYIVFVLKVMILTGLLNVIEALGFKSMGLISKINNRPIMVLWVMNIINNVFGIFKV
jgi:hypothetical protein